MTPVVVLDACAHSPHNIETFWIANWRELKINAIVSPSVAYTDPEVAWAGLTEDQEKAQGIKVKETLR